MYDPTASLQGKIAIIMARGVMSCPLASSGKLLLLIVIEKDTFPVASPAHALFSRSTLVDEIASRSCAALRSLSSWPPRFKTQRMEPDVENGSLT